MEWTHARPVEPGMYYINHSTIPQAILELDGGYAENPELSWEDPNADEGYEYLELPDDTLYAGPLPSAPPMT